MRPRRFVALVLAVLLVSTAGAVVVAAATTPSGPPSVQSPDHATGDARVPASPPTNGSVVVRINLTADGDARWTVSSTFALPNETDREAFRALVEDVRDDAPPAGTVGYSVETYRSFLDRVDRSLDRPGEMRIENPEWNGRVEGGTGVLSLSFTWTNFARTDGDRVILGDVFETGAGWFSGLSADQRLVIAAPPGYALIDYNLSVPFEEGTIFIDGPANLSAKDVAIVYEPTVTPTSTTPTDTPTEPPNGSGPNESGGGSGLLLFGGLLVLAVAAAVVTYVVSNEPFGGDGTAAAESTDGGSGTTSSQPRSGDAGSTPEGTSPTAEATPGGDAAGTGTAAEVSADEAATAEAGTATGAGSGDDVEEASDVDAELLSDEERVERLLEDNGGRMKQANIVSETGWSNAKVSQLLSSMDDEDRIDKLRIGRENLITLPDEDVGEIE